MSLEGFIETMFINPVVSISFLFVLGIRVWIKKPLQTGILMIPIFVGLMVYVGDHLALLQTGGMINWISFLSRKLKLLYMCVLYVVLLEIINLVLLQFEIRKKNKSSNEQE